MKLIGIIALVLLLAGCQETSTSGQNKGPCADAEDWACCKLERYVINSKYQYQRDEALKIYKQKCVGNDLQES